MRRLALATIAAALIVPGAAHAALAPADTMPELGGVLQIARAEWPASPCAGHEQILVTEGIGADNGLDADGGAIPDRCIVALNPRLFAPGARYQLCVIVTHEFGHLAGRVHVTDPHNIMHAVAPADFRPCLELAGIAPVALPVLTQPSVTPPVQHAKAKHKKAKHKKCRQHNKKKRRACKRRHARARKA